MKGNIKTAWIAKGGDFVHNEEHQLLDCHSLYDIESESEDESVSVLLYLIVGKVILIKMDFDIYCLIFK